MKPDLPTGGPSGPSDSGGTRRTGLATELIDVVYDELRCVASAYLRQERPGHTLQTTALVHEAWLRLSQRSEVKFEGRAHFLRAAALAMRRILLHHARAKHALKRGGDRINVALETLAATPQQSGPDIRELNEVLERLEKLDPQKAQVVEMRYFGGCTIEETAEALEISTATVQRHWRFARAWLRAELDDESTAGHRPMP